MAPAIPDHYLWLGLGVFTFFAVRQVSAGLKNIRTLTEIHKPQPNPPSASPPRLSRPEDAIKTSSLLALATSHNTDIRASATRILCTRFYANQSAKKLLFKDLKSKDEDIRHRAHLALNLLCDLGVWKEDVVAPTTPRDEWRVWGPRETGMAEGTGSEQRRELRRRRREAVVIHNGEGAIGREDLYMRDEEGVMGSGEERQAVDESLEGLMHLAWEREAEGV